MLFSLPPAPDPSKPVITRGDVWEILRDAFTRMMNLRVVAPLQIQDTPAGRTFSIADVGREVTVDITSALAGDNAYGAKIGTLKESMPDGSATVAKTDVWDFPSDEDAIVINFSDVSGIAHSLTAGTNAVTTFLGRIVGLTPDGTKWVVVLNGDAKKKCT